MTSTRKVVIALLALVILGGCTPKQVRDDKELAPVEGPRARQIEPEARPLYGQAEKAFAAKNYELAQKLFIQVKNRFPRGAANHFASYRLGIIHYYRENYAVASKEFESFVTHMPQSELAFDANYNWAASEFQLGKADSALQILRKLRSNDIQMQGPRRAETVYQLMARCAQSLGNYPALVTIYSLQLQLPIEDKVRQSVENRVEDSLNKISDRNVLEQLKSEVTEVTVRSAISNRIAALSTVSQETAVLTPPPPATSIVPEGSVATGTPTELPSGGSSGSQYNVGVILPLTGKWATYGRRALDGILLASRVFGAGDSEFRLFVEDSGSNPVTAQAAVENLVRKHDVMAIIGPLSWKEAVAVADRAQTLGVANLSLTSKEGISEKSPYLFQNALTPRVQLESLVRYAVQERNLKRFAILAPNNQFGKDMAKNFWDMSDKYGGKIAAQIFYAPDEKDFQSYVQELVGLGPEALKYRKLETTKLAEYIKEQKTKTGKEPKVTLPPISDFDAIFVPDSPKTVGQIAPSLAYFDVGNLPLLGTTEWNSDQFLKRGGKYVEGAIFPAGLHLTTRNARTQDFIRGYYDAYGIYPDLLATQAFEAMDLIGTAVRSARSGDRNVLVNQLGKLRNFETPLGDVTFDANRIATRRLTILQLDNGGQISEH